MHSPDSADADAKVKQVALEKHKIIEFISKVPWLWARRPQSTVGTPNNLEQFSFVSSNSEHLVNCD